MRGGGSASAGGNRSLRRRWWCLRRRQTRWGRTRKWDRSERYGVLLGLLSAKDRTGRLLAWLSERLAVGFWRLGEGKGREGTRKEGGKEGKRTLYWLR